MENETNTKDDRFYKVRNLINYLLVKFKATRNLGNIIAVDIIMVSYRDRLKFWQYIPRKLYKYEIKMFNVCSPDKYTNNIFIYVGKKVISLKASESPLFFTFTEII